MHNTSPAHPLCVEAREITYRYAGAYEHRAVRSVDLSIRLGETYALLGTNGAGKTTTLEILEGHRAPASGTVTVFGADPRDRRLVRPRVGIMLQDSAAADDLTVTEMVTLGGAVSGRKDDTKSVLERLGLAALAGQRLRTLSGGERRKVDFAIATWGSPELVFLDEPTTGLDPDARERLWERVGELQACGTTVVMTTHYLEEAARHATRIGLMHAGVVSREGTLAELTAGYPSEIRFRCSGMDGLPLAVHRREADGTTVLLTTQLEQDLSRLVLWANATHHSLEGLRTVAPTLDQAFTELSNATSEGN